MLICGNRIGVFAIRWKALFKINPFVNNSSPPLHDGYARGVPASDLRQPQLPETAKTALRPTDVSPQWLSAVSAARMVPSGVLLFHRSKEPMVSIDDSFIQTISILA